MADIRFQFDREKAIQAIAYMAELGLPWLSKMKVCKLLYFADKRHLLNHGRPVLGDWYACMDHGPVPSSTYDLINEVLAPNEATTDSAKLFSEFVGVDGTKKFAEFVTKKPADLDVFTPSELDALKATISELGKKHPYDLRELSHKDPAWLIPDEHRSPGSSVPIEWDLFFQDQPAEAQELLALIRAEQEDRDFATELAK